MGANGPPWASWQGLRSRMVPSAAARNRPLAFLHSIRRIEGLELVDWAGDGCQAQLPGVVAAPYPGEFIRKNSLNELQLSIRVGASTST